MPAERLNPAPLWSPHRAHRRGPERDPREGTGVPGSLPNDEAKRLNPSRLGAPVMPGIATLRANSNATFTATITAISEPREVNTSRGPSTVADATLQDETGTTTLTLWGADIPKYRVGQKIQVTDGWVKEFRGKLQVSMGRSGKVTVLA
jgi:hypothetical protein